MLANQYTAISNKETNPKAEKDTNINSINNILKLGDIVIEGKSKKFYEVYTYEGELLNDTLFMTFKPHLRSVTSKREGNIKGTDLERLYVTNYIFEKLESVGIPTHRIVSEHGDKHGIIKTNGMQGMFVHKTKTIPIEFIVRYYAAGSIVRLYPSLVKPNMRFNKPLYKYDLKQDVSVAGVDDPTLNESYIVGLGLLTQNQLDIARGMLENIGDYVRKILHKGEMDLVDMKMEFGFNSEGSIVLIDEISQDCIRANDTYTWEAMTKDAYRNMKSDEEVLKKYTEFRNRIIG